MLPLLPRSLAERAVLQSLSATRARLEPVPLSSTAGGALQFTTRRPPSGSAVRWPHGRIKVIPALAAPRRGPAIPAGRYSRFVKAVMHGGQPSSVPEHRHVNMTRTE